MIYTESSALVSEDGLYRYHLRRIWNPDRESITFCMLNPSTADASKDDPTIRRCVGFADAWGFGGLVVVNLFALRATDYRDLFMAKDPIGPKNDVMIDFWCAGVPVVCAWGATRVVEKTSRLRVRPVVVLDKLRKISPAVRHLGLSRHGHPKHPLYLPAKTVMQEFAAAGAKGGA